MTTISNTHKLEKLQNHFQSLLINDQKDIQDEIVAPQKGSIVERLYVYGEGYYLRLIEALSIEFPALKNFLGKSFFEKMARTYLKHYPSHSFSVRYIGTYHLPTFLNLFDESRPYLAELATFEIALSNALDATDAPIKTQHDLAKIALENWGNIKFQLHPSVALLNFEWDIPSLWKTAIKKIHKKPIKKSTHALIWRKNLAPFYFEIDSCEAFILKKLIQGESFGDLCQALTAFFPEETAPQQAATMLIHWVKEEMISDIIL